jgi:YVTN family beta-propeller protein
VSLGILRAGPVMVVAVFAALCVDVVPANCQWALDTVVAAGPNCFGVAVTPDGTKLLVTNKDTSGTVTVLSASDYSVLSTIPMYGDYPSGIAVTPNGAKALVTCSNPNAVRLVDLLGDSVLAAFYPKCIATTLYDIAVTPDGQTAVMPDLSDGCVQEGLRWFDTSGKTTGSTFVPVNTSGVTYGVAVAPDSVTVLVTTYVFTTGIKSVNLRTSAVQNIPNVGPSYGVAITHKGDRAVVTSDSVKVINLSTSTVTGAIPFSSNSSFHNVAITPDDKYAFVVGDFYVAIISLDSNAIVQTFSAAGQNVAISPDGKKAYVTDVYNGQLRVYKNVGTGTGIRTPGDGPRVPQALELMQNYPNPFNPTTTIMYGVPAAGFVTLTLYDVAGRSVQTLVSGQRNAGRYEIRLDGTRLPSGIYFLRIEAAGLSQTRKVVLLK